MENLTPINLEELRNNHWFNCLTPWQETLVTISIELFNRELDQKDKMGDYSYIVFSMSKAYEGFMKKFLYNLNLIDKETYEGKKFRIGRALNPDVSPRYRDEFWLYDDVASICDQEAARFMWDTWLQCRNRVFHYFPREKSVLNLNQVKAKLERLIAAMTKASVCMKAEEKRCEEQID